MNHLNLLINVIFTYTIVEAPTTLYSPISSYDDVLEGLVKSLKNNMNDSLHLIVKYSIERINPQNPDWMLQFNDLYINGVDSLIIDGPVNGSIQGHVIHINGNLTIPNIYFRGETFLWNKFWNHKVDKEIKWMLEGFATGDIIMSMDLYYHVFFGKTIVNELSFREKPSFIPILTYPEKHGLMGANAIRTLKKQMEAEQDYSISRALLEKLKIMFSAASLKNHEFQ